MLAGRNSPPCATFSVFSLCSTRSALQHSKANAHKRQLACRSSAGSRLAHSAHTCCSSSLPRSHRKPAAIRLLLPTRQSVAYTALHMRPLWALSGLYLANLRKTERSAHSSSAVPAHKAPLTNPAELRLGLLAGFSRQRHLSPVARKRPFSCNDTPPSKLCPARRLSVLSMRLLLRRHLSGFRGQISGVSRSPFHAAAPLLNDEPNRLFVSFFLSSQLEPSNVTRSASPFSLENRLAGSLRRRR